ncbi:vps51 vps67 domain-containing protein [Moniliophthora roreri MCA 2997]|uniref:Conserved oligomeric Golgi complex subunit 1 n=1 Tax=Moniliophthora roreri (strain MCA 2997) TaxID=1381753 RepID=V2XGA7_MONRO|nr:vps51 vps67 domain-containing protein [Moniliophthora roreri MCA 2997]
MSTTRKASLAAPPMERGLSSSSKLPEDLDPDELFTKHTVSEVRVIQQRLRHDADAKQEELRQMVGERYRDLLQASTSIIAIAQSSKRVIGALDDTKAAIQSQGEPSATRSTTVRENEDVHIHMLQVLSAHIKLLLDVPEHLWRLMEKKKYLTAAWLFLLSRVVHRALIREDERDEEAWNTQGIDVLDQFPLVQRQWEHVSSFRQQIIVRAKQSLQEYAASTEDTCATLLTLHLLESRPLTDILTIFLEKRSKALDALLFQNSHTTLTPSLSRRSKPLEPDQKVTSGKTSTVKEVKDHAILALDCICRTVRTAHEVLDDRNDSQSLIRQVLGYIQSESPETQTSSLPPELKLSTHNLLTTLPSSAHFLLLPQNLRSYRPYVDLASSSSSLPQKTLCAKVDEWFEKSIDGLQSAIQRWLGDVRSVKNVWAVRLDVNSWINSSQVHLPSGKVSHLQSVVNDLCQRRIVDLWKASLEDAGKVFRDRLTEVVAAFDDKRAEIGAFPVQLLFKAPSLPTASQIGVGSSDASFQRYRTALNRQLLGRTPLLDDILKGLEACALGMHHDITQVLSEYDDGSSTTLGQGLVQVYRPLAQTLCEGVTSTLHSVAENLSIEDQAHLDALIFTGHVADELSHSSPFVINISCEPDVARELRLRCAAIFESSIDRWRDYIVSFAITKYRSTRIIFSRAHNDNSDAPSSNIVEALLYLADALKNLGTSRNISRQLRIADRTVHMFLYRLLKSEDMNGTHGLYDLRLLQNLSESCGSESSSSWGDVRSQLDAKIYEITANDTRADARTSEYLARMQVLLAALLPKPKDILPASTPLLPLGVPILGKDVPSALDLADSGARFGLLLIN